MKYILWDRIWLCPTIYFFILFFVTIKQLKNKFTLKFNIIKHIIAIIGYSYYFKNVAYKHTLNSYIILT